MQILHCSTKDSGGGAYIAAHRIHSALRDHGVDSFMYVKKAERGDPTVLWKKPSISCRIWNAVAHKFEEIVRRRMHRPPQTAGPCFFNFLPGGYATALKDIPRDLTHLHWVSDRFLLPSAIGQIPGPIIWTLHDRWPLTGGCHILQNCSRYQQHCGQCPQLGSTHEWDLSRLCWRLRNWFFRDKNFHVVCPSQSLSEDVKRSSLLGSFPVTVIPNCLPIDVYRDMNKLLARSLLRIPVNEDKPIILFGAMAATKDLNKGHDLLMHALGRIPKEKYRCLVFGACAPLQHSDHDTLYLGSLHDDISLSLAYNAADIFVCPSREEAFSLTTLESLACGTPVVGFSIGGLPDMIEHGEQGFLAQPYDTAEMAHHITTLLNDITLRQRMGRAARKKVEQCYAPKVVAQQYINLYESLLAQN